MYRTNKSVQNATHILKVIKTKKIFYVKTNLSLNMQSSYLWFIYVITKINIYY